MSSEYKVGQSVGASLNFVRFDNLNPLNEIAPYDKSNFNAQKVAIIIFFDRVTTILPMPNQF